jgi:hypothetical protein
MLIMISLLVSLFAINMNFNIAVQKVDWPEKLFIHLPFSLYLGWICVATIANIDALSVYLGGSGTNIPWTIFLISTCTITVSLLVIKRKNIITGAVALWALYGIVLKRQEANGPAAYPIIAACIIAMAVILLFTLIQLMKKR